MRRTLILTLARPPFFAMPLRPGTNGPKECKSKSGDRVVTSPAGKKPRRADFENRIEFYSPENQRLCAVDFSSEDSEHGFGVLKAAWTPDEEYFVFPLASSGGHQPWLKPTLFYDVRYKIFRSLDNYTEGPRRSKGDFGLEPPDTRADNGVPRTSHAC